LERVRDVAESWFRVGPLEREKLRGEFLSSFDAGAA
jgi:hypothetical protein